MQHQAGFNIVELIVTLVIAGVLVALAAPNMAIFLRNSERTSLLNDLVTSVQFARSQAVTRNQRITICPVDVADAAGGGADAFNSAAPAGACLGTGVFETGWVVFVDTGATTGQIDAGETILRVFSTPKPSSMTFRATDGANNPVASVSYLGTGLSEDFVQLRHFKYCDDRNPPSSSARAVVLSVSGQPRVSQDTDGDGTDNLTGAGDDELACP